LHHTSQLFLEAVLEGVLRYINKLLLLDISLLNLILLGIYIIIDLLYLELENEKAPFLQNYAAGNPAMVLYIKNLAKDVVSDDFYFIFGMMSDIK